MNAKPPVKDASGKFYRSYRKWSSMHRRCTDINYQGFARYGALGITVCLRWSGKDGYANFLTDMGEPPAGMTLDRHPDNNGNYEPSNCRWATWQQQAQSRKPRSASPPNPSTLYGRARLAGLPPAQVYMRITALGWSEQKALSTPMRKRGSGQSVLRDGAIPRNARQKQNSKTAAPTTTTLKHNHSV